MPLYQYYSAEYSKPTTTVFEPYNLHVPVHACLTRVMKCVLAGFKHYVLNKLELRYHVGCHVLMKVCTVCGPIATFNTVD